MEKFNTIFKTTKPVIGMIHIKALPGAPKNVLTSTQIIEEALKEAEMYNRAGVDAVMIENMHDLPYLKEGVGHEISTLMSIIAYQIKEGTKMTVGIQILAGANMEALAAAKAANADFIRAEGFVYGHLADEGMMDAQAGTLLRFRKQIDANDIAIFTDIKKKHSSHAITQDISLLDTAKAAQFFLSDGVIVTGDHTGEAPCIEELRTLKNTLNIPVILGSGITKENVTDYFPLCDALIIGSYFKEDGHWENRLNYDRVTGFMDVIKR